VSYVQVPFQSPLNLVPTHPLRDTSSTPEYRVILPECNEGFDVPIVAREALRMSGNFTLIAPPRGELNLHLSHQGKGYAGVVGISATENLEVRGPSGPTRHSPVPWRRLPTPCQPLSLPSRWLPPQSQTPLRLTGLRRLP
jgi:hypothetical protein